MSRLIDADALMKSMYHRAFETDDDTMWHSGCWVRYRAIEQTVKEQPTIEPKKGRWIKCEDRAGWYCSECATDDYYAYLYNSDTGVYELQDKFCPSCGARMEE